MVLGKGRNSRWVVKEHIGIQHVDFLVSGVCSWHIKTNSSASFHTQDLWVLREITGRYEVAGMSTWILGGA